MSHRRRIPRIAILVVLGVLLAGGCGWTRYRGDTRHTGTNPAEHAIGLSDLSALAPSWTTPDRHFWWEPIVSGGKVLDTTRVSIYAFDEATGAQLWRRTDLISPHQVSYLGQPTTGAGAVYVSNVWADGVRGGGTVRGATTVALDPATGTTLASYDGGSDLPPLVTDDGWVYLASATATALDAHGPHGERFSVATPMRALDIVGDGDAVRAVSGTAVQTIAPHGCGQPTCSALRTDVVPGTVGTPAVLAENADTIFVLHEYMLDAYARNGCGGAVCNPLWTSRSPVGQIDGLVVTDDTVYVTAGRLEVFDAHGCGATTCDPRWEGAADPSETFASPAVANGMLLTSAYGNGLVGIAAWSTEGCAAPPCAPVWTLPQAVSAHPVVSDGALYFLVQTGYGLALRKLVVPV